MNNISQCIIDNWSLECAAAILEHGLHSVKHTNFYHPRPSITATYAKGTAGGIPPSDIEANYVGTLSNVILAVTMFDSIAYIRNGFDYTWKQYPMFVGELGSLIACLDSLNEYKSEYASDFLVGGLRFYMDLGRVHDRDIILNPQRSQLFEDGISNKQLTYRNYVEDLFGTLDETIRRKLTTSPSHLLRMSAISQFTIPPLLHYVLTQSTSRNDVLRVARQLRELKSVIALRRLLHSISRHSCKEGSYVQLVDQLDNIARDMGKEIEGRKSSGSIGVSIGVVSVSWDIEGKLATRDHRLFIKSVARSRMELNSNAGKVRELIW